MIAIKRLLESGMLSDVRIACKERVWKAHKVILCARSEWFTKALTGNWQVMLTEAILKRW